MPDDVGRRPIIDERHEHNPSSAKAVRRLRQPRRRPVPTRDRPRRRRQPRRGARRGESRRNQRPASAITTKPLVSHIRPIVGGRRPLVSGWCCVHEPCRSVLTATATIVAAQCALRVPAPSAWEQAR
jgi:hypothetical protein